MTAPVTDVHAHRAGCHHEQPVLEGAPLDHSFAGLDVHLLEQAGHRDQRVPGDLAEQRCPVEHADALHGHHLVCGGAQPARHGGSMTGGVRHGPAQHVKSM